MTREVTGRSEDLELATPAAPPSRAKPAPPSRRLPLHSWASIVVGLVLWQLAGDLLVRNSLFLATPLQVVAGLSELIASGELARHIETSALEFVIGFAIASVIGIALGLAMASSERAGAWLNPWVYGLYATPILALAPLLILWFGIGIWSKVAVVISLVLFPIAINTEAGIRSTDPQLLEPVRAFGATRAQLFRKVSLPSAVPFILAGLRLGVGRGLVGVVVGELFGSRGGLGFLVYQSAQVFNMPQLFAGVVVLAAAGIALTAGFQAIERRLLHWRGD